MDGPVTAIRSAVGDSVEAHRRLAGDDALLTRCAEVVELLCTTLRHDGAVWFCGNGGSAADAQHLAAELSGRYAFDRPPLRSEALHVNTSYLTAVANDYGYDHVYSRLIAGNGRAGDVLVCLTTSGNSPNILAAAEQARRSGISVVGLTGAAGGKLAASCDILLAVPSTETPRIQECHILLGHTICGAVESAMFPDGNAP